MSYVPVISRYGDMVSKRSAFIDESGSFGFDFAKEGTGRYFVVCAVIVENENISALDGEVKKLRKLFFSGKELKSSSIGSDKKTRAAILSELAKFDFSVIILIADKNDFTKDGPLSKYKQSFIKYLNLQLLSALFHYFPQLDITADEHGTDEFKRSYREYVENNMPEPGLFSQYDFCLTDSQKSDIVQIADIIAGSVMRRLESRDEPNVLRIIQKKITEQITFPRQKKRYYTIQNEPSSFDELIFETASKLAFDYVDSHRNETEEIVRLRVIFVSRLLFLIYNAGDSYTYSQTIVSELRALSRERITGSFLCRKIVAPLRDEGLLIASSPHGYKIPTSVKDISTYVNQSITVAGPMMKRINKCRKTIAIASGGNLDIFDDASLVQYKKYFDGLD